MTWQVNFIIPENTGAAFVKLNPLKQSSGSFQKIIAGDLFYIVFYIVDHTPSIIK